MEVHLLKQENGWSGSGTSRCEKEEDDTTTTAFTFLPCSHFQEDTESGSQRHGFLTDGIKMITIK
jgi:hypothetical protein